MPKYQAYFFKIRIARLILDYAYDAYEQNVFNKGYDATFLLPSLFKSEIHNDVLTSREIIKQYCLYVLKLQLIDKIDRYHLGGIDFNGLFVTKGSLGDLAQYCLKYLDTQEISYLSLIDILDTFKLLRKRIKKKKDKDSKAYIQLINSRLEELKQEIKTTGNNSKDILKRINQQLKKFKTKKGSI